MKAKMIRIFGVLLAAFIVAWMIPAFAQGDESERAQAERHRQELKEKLTALQSELRELESAGKEERAAEVRKQAERIKRALMAEAPRPERPKTAERGRTVRIEREVDREPEATRADMERRREHLRVAIDNLRAAGLPDLAERVGQEGKRILAGEMRPVPVLAGRPGPMIEELRNELRELREAVQNLDRRTDELARQTAELRKRREGEPR